MRWKRVMCYISSHQNTEAQVYCSACQMRRCAILWSLIKGFLRQKRSLWLVDMRSPGHHWTSTGRLTDMLTTTITVFNTGSGFMDSQKTFSDGVIVMDLFYKVPEEKSTVQYWITKLLTGTRMPSLEQNYGHEKKTSHYIYFVLS